jgi:hypothetical protein
MQTIVKSDRTNAEARDVRTGSFAVIKSRSEMRLLSGGKRLSHVGYFMPAHQFHDDDRSRE